MFLWKEITVNFDKQDYKGVCKAIESFINSADSTFKDKHWVIVVG